MGFEHKPPLSGRSRPSIGGRADVPGLGGRGKFNNVDEKDGQGRGTGAADRRRNLTPQERQRKAEIFKSARPAENVKRGDPITGKVYNVTDEGAFILTDEKYIGLIHKDEQAHPLKIGMVVEGRVTFVRPDGRINLSLRPQKEVARVVDAEKILEYIKKRNGSMPFNDSSPPEIIKERFGISKAAFKRALGKLLKEGLVEEREGWVVIKDNEELQNEELQD